MRHYALKSFLRAAPNDLLAQYFQRKSISTDADFSKLKARNIEPVAALISNLPEKLRQEVDTDFQDIFALSYEAGLKLLLEEATYEEINLIPEFEQLKGYYAKAFWAFLNHRTIFDAALTLSCRINLTGHWKIRRNLPSVPTNDFGKRKTTLAASVSSYFRTTEGRGQHCTIDYYERGNLHFYFAYPEGYSQTIMHYKNGQLHRDHYSAAFEVIFVYDTKAGSLEIYHEGNKQTIFKLQEIFTQTIMGLNKLPPDNKPAYDLEPLKNSEFQFTYPPESGIIGTKVKRLGFSSFQDGELVGFGIQADSNIYTMLDNFSPLHPNDGRPSRSNTMVRSAHIQVSFAPKPKQKRIGTRTFYLTNPDGTNLGHTGRDAVIRKMLKDSGVMLDDTHTRPATQLPVLQPA